MIKFEILLPLFYDDGRAVEREKFLQTDCLSRWQPGRRAGSAEAFAAMSKRGDDRLLHGDELLPTRWEKDEWKWQ